MLGSHMVPLAKMVLVCEQVLDYIKQRNNAYDKSITTRQ
jgi:hypothetical protein